MHDSIPRDARIFVAGHRGLVGSAIVRRLETDGFTQHPDRHPRAARPARPGRRQLLVPANRPEYVFLVAGTVGGIMANSTRPAEFIYDNMMIHATVVHAAHLYGVDKLLYLGSSCIYPRLPPQPMTEEQLLTGPLEPTNEAYAIAKIAGIKLCQAYRTPVRLRLHLGDADQPVRPERQLRPRELARAARADPQVPRREDARRSRRVTSGAPARRGASSFTSTTWPMPACS